MKNHKWDKDWASFYREIGCVSVEVMHNAAVLPKMGLLVFEVPLHANTDDRHTLAPEDHPFRGGGDPRSCWLLPLFLRKHHTL